MVETRSSSSKQKCEKKSTVGGDKNLVGKTQKEKSKGKRVGNKKDNSSPTRPSKNFCI